MIQKIGVIGAGQMGGGIAHVCALHGFHVVLMDVNPEALRRAQETIRRNMERQAGKGKISKTDLDAAMGRIQTGTDFRAFTDCDLVIEAATENEDVKREVFKNLVPHLKKEAMVATKIGRASCRERVCQYV